MSTDENPGKQNTMPTACPTLPPPTPGEALAAEKAILEHTIRDAVRWFNERSGVPIESVEVCIARVSSIDGRLDESMVSGVVVRLAV